jgi:hypothetical protein
MFVHFPRTLRSFFDYSALFSFLWRGAQVSGSSGYPFTFFHEFGISTAFTDWFQNRQVDRISLHLATYALQFLPKRPSLLTVTVVYSSSNVILHIPRAGCRRVPRAQVLTQDQTLTCS